MDMLNSVVSLIFGLAERIIGYIDMIMGAFSEGKNKYIIYAVFLYLIGVFGTAKVRLNLKTGTKK